MPDDSRVLIARIGAPHGVRGEVRVELFADDPQALIAYGPLFAAGGRRFTVTSVRRGKGGVIAVLDGVGDRTGAERLNGTELFAERAAFPPTGEHEFYHADLIGLAAVDPEGRGLGQVVAVHNHGAGDILEIAPPEGETMLMPFNRATFPKVDIAGGRILVVPPAEIEVRGENAEEEATEPASTGGTP